LTAIREVTLVKKNEQSRHIGGKPGVHDEAENRKNRNAEQPTPDQKKGASVKPRNSDVGNQDKDR
jgi:hypothetical protein